MLKRLRPATPPPLAPSDAPSPPFDMSTRRDSKRRRLSPPILDGRPGGWDGGSNVDNEEEILSNDELTGDQLYTPVDSNEYKGVNTILHELHILHQHKFLFSSTHPSNHLIHNQYYPSTPDFDRGYMPLKVISAPHIHAHAGVAPSMPPITAQGEASLVTERYGDTNKLLGSLFLSRRKELDAAVDAP